MGELYGISVVSQICSFLKVMHRGKVGIESQVFILKEILKGLARETSTRDSGDSTLVQNES